MIQPFKTSVRRMRIIMCKYARGNLPARDESPAVRDKSGALVRANPELPCPTEPEAGCRFFHPSDEDLSPGTPAFHPRDEDLSPGTPAFHPRDEDLSPGTPGLVVASA